MSIWPFCRYMLIKTEVLVVRPAKYGHLFETLSVNIAISESSTIKTDGCDFWFSSDILVTHQGDYQHRILYLSNTAKMQHILSLIYQWCWNHSHCSGLTWTSWCIWVDTIHTVRNIHWNPFFAVPMLVSWSFLQLKKKISWLITPN